MYTLHKVSKCTYPTTSDPEEALPTGKLWYIPLWLGVLSVLSPEAASAFIGIHHNNIIVDNEEQEPPAVVEVPRLHSLVADKPIVEATGTYVSQTPQLYALTIYLQDTDTGDQIY